MSRGAAGVRQPPWHRHAGSDDVSRRERKCGYSCISTHLVTMIPVENERGERLLSVKEINEADASALPVTFSLVIGRNSFGFLLVHNRSRRVWELPGGFIDPGESARKCAVRETEEESGQKVSSLRWRAVLEIEARRDATTRTSFGALYCASISEAKVFASSSEVDAIGFWFPNRLPMNVSAIDKELLAYYV